MSDTSIRTFTIVYNDLWSSTLITVSEKEVLATLKSFCDKDNVCFPTVRKIAERLGCCIRKVRYTIAKLKEKHIISVKHQYRKSDNSQTSNYYIIYDLKEVWEAKSVEEIKEIVEKYEEKKRFEALETLKEDVPASKNKPPNTQTDEIKTTDENIQKNIQVKEKEIENIAHSAKGNNDNQSQSHKLNQETSDSCFNSNTRIDRSQEEIIKEVYSMKFLKNLYDYDTVLSNESTSYYDIDINNNILDIIYDTVNFSKNKIRIGGNYIPKDVVINRLLKLGYADILYVGEKYNNQTNRIHNQRAYLLTLLYYAKDQHNLDIKNQVNYDMANTDWTEYWAKRNRDNSDNDT